MLYFAYGSNLDSARLERRVGRVVEKGVASLPAWEVRERLYADVSRTRRQGACVLGALYELTDEQLRALVVVEDAPSVYRRVRMYVRSGRSVVPAWVYVLTPLSRAFRDRLAFPAEYLRTCRRGAAEHGFAFAL